MDGATRERSTPAWCVLVERLGMRGLSYDREGFVEAGDGTRLFYGVRGEGPLLPIVLNDGIGCDGFVWHYLQPHLAEERTVVHWHYRGHGRSGAPSDRRTLSVASLAADLERLVEHLGIEKAVMMGHSMGSQVQLELFRRAPERVAAFVFLCGSCGRITHTFHGGDVLAQILPGVRATARRHRGIARAVWGRVPPSLAYRLARLSGEVDPDTIREDDFRRYWEHVCVMDPDDFLELLESAGDHSAEDLLGEIAIPSIVVAAERDTFTPPEHARNMANAIPGADMFLIRGGSHAAPVEQPMTVQLRVDKFLRERVDFPSQAAEADPGASGGNARNARNAMGEQSATDESGANGRTETHSNVSQRGGGSA